MHCSARHMIMLNSIWRPKNPLENYYMNDYLRSVESPGWTSIGRRSWYIFFIVLGSSLLNFKAMCQISLVGLMGPRNLLNRGSSIHPRGKQCTCLGLIGITTMTFARRCSNSTITEFNTAHSIIFNSIVYTIGLVAPFNVSSR